MTTSVNAKRILKYALEGKFSNGTFQTCIKELLQNSRRAGARNVNIEVDNNYLTYRDDGNGVSNWMSVIILGDSDWDMEISGVEDPAGFGLFSLYASANLVKIKSGDNEAVFVPSKLIDDEYFKKLSERISGFNNLGRGFYLEAELKNEVTKTDIDDIKNVIRYFYMIDKITVNGEDIEKIDVNKIKAEAYKVVKYQDNDLIIGTDALVHYASFSGFPPLKIIWRGEVIKTSDWFYSKERDYVLFVIEKGSPLDISLPYREDIVINKKYDKLKNFIDAELKSIIDKCLGALEPGIYEIPGMYSKDKITIPLEKEIAIRYLRANKGSKTAEINIFHINDSLEYPSYSFLIYGQHDVKSVEKHLKDFGICKIGLVDFSHSRLLQEYEEIQYPENSVVYSISWVRSKTSINKIIKNIPIIKTTEKQWFYNIKPYILDSKVDTVFFMYNPARGSLLLYAKNYKELKKAYKEKIKYMRLIDEALKSVFFYAKGNGEESASHYELADYAARETEIALAGEFLDKEAIIDHIIKHASEVLSKNKLIKLKKYLKNMV